MPRPPILQLPVGLGIGIEFLETTLRKAFSPDCEWLASLSGLMERASVMLEFFKAQ
jgi:hypothetical protein